VSAADIVAIVTLVLTVAGGIVGLLTTREQIRDVLEVLVARVRRLMRARAHAAVFVAVGAAVAAALQLGHAPWELLVAVAPIVVTGWYGWLSARAVPVVCRATYDPAEAGAIDTAAYADGAETIKCTPDGRVLTTDVATHKPYVYFRVDPSTASRLRRAGSVVFVVEYATGAPTPPRLEYDSKTLKYRRRDLRLVGTRRDTEAWSIGLVLVGDARFAGRQQPGAANADFRLSSRFQEDYDLRIRRLTVTGINV
jgi:hypothetical protein